MGNSASRNKARNTVEGGHLDSTNRLETAYAEILALEEVKSDLKRVFRDLRILVMGRSGSGKTTLIRLVVGGKGPQTISDGRAGMQDISVEWHHPDPELPVIFHDSNIPILLVMTFNDVQYLVKRNVTKPNLERLLGRIKDVQKREKAQKEMVKIGNDIHLEDNEVTGTKDVDGLKNLIERTKELIGKKLQYTWVSCQAIDADHKLAASASLIVRYKKALVLGTLAVGALPCVHQLQLAYMFAKVLACLCKIWNVPPNLKKAIFQEFYAEEGRYCILRNLFHNLAAGLGLVVCVGVSVITAGAATPAIIAVVAAAGLSQMKGSPVLLMSFSFLILGVILYVKSMQITKEHWDADKSVEQYKKYCEEFACSNYPTNLKSFAHDTRSAWETTIRTKHQKERVKAQIIDFFNRVMLNRPTSLFTVMQQTDQEAHGAPWSHDTGESNNMQSQPDQGTLDYQDSGC